MGSHTCLLPGTLTCELQYSLHCVTIFMSVVRLNGLARNLMVQVCGVEFVKCLLLAEKLSRAN